MTTTRIALAGLGAAAKSIHLKAYAKLDQLQVVGAHDPGLAAAEAGATGFGFALYDSLEELLKRCKPHILTIASPTPFHFESAKQALQAGCHVFCEKPFTTTLEEAHELIDLARSCERRIVVNNEFRCMNIYEAAAQAIGSPDFGELLFLSAQQVFFVDERTEAGWRGHDPQRTCKEFGIHVLDLARFFFGAEPVSIDARMPKPGDPEGPDYLNLIQLDFGAGRVAHISLDRLTRGRHRYLDLRLDGTKSTIETEFGGQIEFKAGIRGGDRKPFAKLEISMGGRALQYRGERSKKIASDPLDIFANATSKLMAGFLESLRSGAQPACSAEDNIKTLALMLAAYESAELGRPVEFAKHWT